MGAGPARLTGHKAQALFKRVVIDLVDNAVNLKGKRGANGRHIGMKGRKPGRIGNDAPHFGNRETGGRISIQKFGLRRGEIRVRALTDAVCIKVQRT